MTAGAVRAYDKAFDWIYQEGTPPPQAGAGLIGVNWDGLDLDTGDQPGGLCLVVENVDGWTDSSPVDGHDAERSVADGSAWGPKTLGARTVTMTGVGIGPRDLLGGFRDALARRAGNRQPAALTITDGLGDARALTASVRADTDALSVKWLSKTAFRYQAVLTAADPLLYENRWQQAVLTPGGPGDSGRDYQRLYAWRYASSDTPSSVQLPNSGNAPAPVWALYEGDLLAPVLRDSQGDAISLADVGAGMALVVATDDLSAWAAGGASRAWYVLPGSVPLLVPPQASARWSLYSQGSGRVTLAWRSAWS
jgi:hypothetical protein